MTTLSSLFLALCSFPLFLLATDSSEPTEDLNQALIEHDSIQTASYEEEDEPSSLPKKGSRPQVVQIPKKDSLPVKKQTALLEEIE